MDKMKKDINTILENSTDEEIATFMVKLIGKD